ncbi:hypothetical protein ACHAWU_003133 [Discostella pseudostelligera]|uniref:Protein kinase domain-containing protein n=1 Tax=Discostella pseudostelligera TaxID=259834 RepID=A0ABD3M7Z1_9STRA
MGTPPRQQLSRLGEKVDSKTMAHTKKSSSSSSPVVKQLHHLCVDSPSTSTPGGGRSLRKLRGQHRQENVENNAKSSKSSSINNVNSSTTKGTKNDKSTATPDASDSPSTSSSIGTCTSLLLEPRITRRNSSSSIQTLIPCEHSLPVITEEKGSSSSRLRKSPRTSKPITKPKLSPRKDPMSPPSRPPLPPPSTQRNLRSTLIDEKRGQLHKSPRRSSSSSITSSSKPTLSPTTNNNGPISPLLPPRTLRAITDAKYFHDFTTLTPIILYGDDDVTDKGTRHPNPPQSAPPPTTSSSNQHYHQSPYWSGQVRVNPFSPVPEQYLRPPPPSSIQSVTRESRKRSYRSSFYGGLTNISNNRSGSNSNGGGGGGGAGDLPTLPTDTTFASMAPPPQAKKARFHHSNSLILPRSSSAEVAPDITSVLPLFNIVNVNASRDEEGGEKRMQSEISPTDVMVHPMTMTSGYDDDSSRSGSTKPPPQSMDSDAWKNSRTNNNTTINNHNQINNTTRMPVKRGRYLDDFQEVQFLGAGSFGSVYACLSRLDGCMYAVKSISPAGRVSTLNKKGSDILLPGCGNEGAGNMGGNNEQYLYGKYSTSITSSSRRDLPPSPQRRKKTFSRLGGIGLNTNSNNNIAGDDYYNLECLEGSRHWNEGALRRVLREVFALAALCQQDDFRTFHIVRYQQAWLEEDGTLYIQTELCTATLRDEMSGTVAISEDVLSQSTTTGGGGDVVAAAGGQNRINVFRQLKILREVLLALELVHQQGMVHLDIKPENIFVKNNLYKLGDFGLANAFTTNGGITSVADIEEGDSRYMSKDLLDNSPKDLTKCDIFSLGATMYEVCSRQPLPSCGQDWQDLRNGKLPLLPGTMPSLIAIIKEMMHPDPDKRPSATDLLSRDTLRTTHDANPLRRESAPYKVGQMQSSQPLTRSASWTI